MSRIVFIDANVVINEGKPPGGALWGRVADLVKGGFIEVLTTDVTVAEVLKHHVSNEYKIIQDLGRHHLRLLVDELIGVKLPPLSKGDLRELVRMKYKPQVEGMFEVLSAKVLPIDSVKASTVLSDYSNERGFFSGEGKKDQFPDAFIFECLKAEASAKTPITIISGDGDFIGPSAKAEHITVCKSLPNLFKELNLEIDAPEIEAFLDKENEEIKKLFNDEITNWGLEAIDVEDASIDDIDVVEVKLQDVVSFKPLKVGENIVVAGIARIRLTASYFHPDWANASYDSEDGILIPHDDVSGETEIKIEAPFSLSVLVDDDGNPSQAEDLRFRDSKFQWVEIHPYNPYEYK